MKVVFLRYLQAKFNGIVVDSIGIIGNPNYSYAHFWSSTENDDGAYNLWLKGDDDNIYFDHPNMDYGYSVRCLKNE